MIVDRTTVLNKIVKGDIIVHDKVCESCGEFKHDLVLRHGTSLCNFEDSVIECYECFMKQDN